MSVLSRGLGRIYGAGVAWRNRGYEQNRRKMLRLAAPVVSIGNLSLGGSGKTPAVIALAAAWRARGLQVDVLSRGYGRTTREMVVLAFPDDASTRQAGDEPRLIARRAGVPVVVHADRWLAGRAAEASFHSQLHLLDDGFQHRRLARQADVVLVHPHDLSDLPLPAGRMREPLSALARATVILYLPDEDHASGVQEPESILRRYTQAPIFTARKIPSAVRRLDAAAGHDTLPLRPEPDLPVMAFCAIARPQSFWRTLDRMGWNLVARQSFRDHHRYRAGELRELFLQGLYHHAKAWITTEKDALNLPAQITLPHLLAVEMSLEISGLEAMLDHLEAVCGISHPSHRPLAPEGVL